MLDRSEFDVIMKVLSIVEQSVRARTTTPALLANKEPTYVAHRQERPQSNNFVDEKVDDMLTKAINSLVQTAPPDEPQDFEDPLTDLSESEGML